ncbi:hypothetical protein [Chelativorans alearense]|uniref:hypothetical protein n=1 Tax=Chelativorans alearense TaxID=2681495 RepID=UPI0013D75FE5|nr:hypothetical protein [Chelativorans alearense]
MRATMLAAAVLVVLSAEASAQTERATPTQEFTPIIISERVQEIAAEYPLAGRLGIEWPDATQEDMGRYIGLLAAAQTIASEIARRSDRAALQDSDYRAAFITLCFWPNKPPLVEFSWDAQMSAFYDVKERTLIKEALGDDAIALSAYVEAGDVDKLRAAVDALPQDPEDYFSTVFDAPLVSEGR